MYTDSISHFKSGINICVFGPPGSGKTTLSKNLSSILSIEHIQMDDIYNDFLKLTGFPPDDRDMYRLVNRLYLNTNNIITDGGYKSTLKRRIDASDIIIYYQPSSLSCMYSCFYRSLKNIFLVTSAHYTTREGITKRIRYFLNPRIYFRIMNFKNKYILLLNELNNNENKIIITLNSRKEAAHLEFLIKNNIEKNN